MNAAQQTLYGTRSFILKTTSGSSFANMSDSVSFDIVRTAVGGAASLHPAASEDVHPVMKTSSGRDACV